MKPPDWERIQEIYHSALEQPRSQRDAFVAEACAGDLALLRQLKSLLEADESPGRLLDSPVTILDPVPSNLVGTTLRGRYVVERELRHGGMSHVYLARDSELNGQRVIIKVLLQDLAQQPHLRKKFEHEVEALLRIDHRGVVRVRDRGELADRRPYFVMDYVDGETLGSQITPEGMNLKRAASILKQIGEALEHVHSKGIFHRDLKPENIMLRRGTDEAVLIDFGIAKVTDPEMAPNTTHSVPIGTLPYMSPEQLLNKEVTAATDIYAMAVVAFEIITGQRPFNATSVPEVLDLQERGVRRKLKQLGKGLSPDAQEIISKALSYEPQSRYQHAKEFGDELASALLPVSQPPPLTIWERIWKHRYPLTAALIAVLVLVSFAVYRYINPPSEPRLQQLIGNTRPTPTPTPTPLPPSHSFRYWLTVQRMRGSQKYEEPVPSNGEETFLRGDQFYLTVFSLDPGYIYVFNEGPSEPNDTNFRLIYPRSRTNAGSATVGANQSIETDPMTFRGPAGGDNFWIVWSVSTVPEIESVKNEAFKHPKGGLTGEILVKLKQFLQMKKAEVEVNVRHYNEPPKVYANGKGDLLITLAQFKHH